MIKREGHTCADAFLRKTNRWLTCHNPRKEKRKGNQAKTDNIRSITGSYPSMSNPEMVVQLLARPLTRTKFTVSKLQSLSRGRDLTA